VIPHFPTGSKTPRFAPFFFRVIGHLLHMKQFRWLAVFGLIAVGFIRVEGAQAKTQLILSHAAAKPGEVVTAAVVLKMPPRWHTYWTFAGDSGAATKIEWELPPGITAGEILWPVPDKLIVAGLTTYIYEGEASLLVPLQIAKDVKSGSVELKAKVSWLECDESCIPGKGDVQATLVISDQSKTSEQKALIDQARARLPLSAPPFPILASWSSPPTDKTRLLTIDIGKADTNADFYPFGSEDFDIAGETTHRENALVKKVEKSSDNWPSLVKGLLVTGSGLERKGYDVALNLEATPSAASEIGASASGKTALPTAPPAAASLVAMLGLAFLGGLILNIMPCVLPVIALKILGFVSQSRKEPKRVRQLGLIYASGVLVSFLVLAGFVIGVKSAGGLASWGMQFQNPKFLVAMIVLVTLVALNLFGVFEITLGGNAMGAAGNLASRDGAAGAFFNGVLATALATPCTAPFLGAALGFAFTQPALTVVLIFLTVGLGLAAPYVVLCWQPGWLKFLPKPGAWMEKFKIAMGFPMLATAVWLFSVALAHFPNGGALWLGLFLVVIGFCAWVWGEFVQRGTKHRGFAMVAAVIGLAAGYFSILEGQLHWRARAGAGSARGPIENNGGIAWERWSPEAVEKARKAGKPVLVDFTADWCLTCQVNKKTSLEIDAVRAKLKAIGAVALVGDYTSEDPAITRELIRNQRAAVPLVLVYPANLAADPIILPSILKPSFVLEALDTAAKSARTASTR
jgi:thiol:disulfide interchange protein DsbD